MVHSGRFMLRFIREVTFNPLTSRRIIRFFNPVKPR